ncbi:MAG: cytochrome c3 family protein, partial [Desulfobulbaceae bacterium]|nr:cytochrome c3 family protein [Desulfobulbaceae bacterium]
HLPPTHARLTKSSGCTTSCHTGTNLIADIHKNICVSCHTATTGVLKGSAVNGPGDCQFCHTLINPASPHIAQHDYIKFDDTPALSCVACHNSNGASEHMGRTTENGPITCTSCHDPNNTSYQDKIYWGKRGVSIYCRECHGGYRTTNHPLDVMPDHLAQGYVTNTPSCAACHDPSGSADLIVVVHKNNCNACHSTIDFSLTGSATGHLGGGSCTVCHGAAGHDTTMVHDHRPISFGTGINCSNCHSSDSSNLGQKGSGALTSQADVDALHSRITGNSCALCHSYNAATQANSEGLPLKATVTSAIANGRDGTTDATCVVCHSYNQTGHGYIDHVALGKVTGSAKCVSCHDQVGQGDDAMYVLSIHNKSGNGCGTCHLSVQGGGALKAPYEDINGGQGGGCVTCHTDYDTDFGAGHQFEDHAVISGLVNCTSCHGGDILKNVHGNGSVAECLNCHA